MLFAKLKKLKYSLTKCYNMIINEAEGSESPNLPLDSVHSIIETLEMTYLGDVFNSKGNNEGLINDRLNRGIKAMVTITALMAENEVGIVC